MSKTGRIPIALSLVSILFVSNSCPAAQKPGPHGGKVLKAGKAVIEFTVDKDEHPHIFRLNDKGETIAMDGMKVALKALTPKKAMNISLSRTTEGLGAEADEVEHLAGGIPMPEPDEYPAEISIKLGKLSKKFRFQYMAGFCAECGLPAFSCTCTVAKGD